MGYVVTLVRGPLPMLNYQHDDGRQARRQAAALADLHGTGGYETFGQPDAAHYVVDASDFYQHPRRMCECGRGRISAVVLSPGGREHKVCTACAAETLANHRDGGWVISTSSRPRE